MVHVFVAMVNGGVMNDTVGMIIIWVGIWVVVLSVAKLKSRERSDSYTMISVVAVVFLLVGVFWYASKLDREANALSARSDDVIATATSMADAEVAAEQVVKADKLRGAATGMRIGFSIGVLAALGALIAKRRVR